MDKPDFINKYDIVLFFLLAYSITWIILGPLALKGLGIISFEVPFWLHDLGPLGPTLAAMVVLILVSDENALNDLFDRITMWPGEKVWWLVAFSPIFIFIGSFLLMLMIGYQMPPVNHILDSELIKGNNYVITIIFPALMFGIFEEIGWRGYALPRLQEKFNALTSTLILGVLWAGWHIPAFFYRYSFSDPFKIFGFWFGILMGAVLLTFLYNGSRGSVLLPMVWHVLFDIFNILGQYFFEEVNYVQSFVVISFAVIIIFVWKAEALSPRGKHSLAISHG
ncbi:MAG: CPBP family intramembrane glutamic endopeptidase [Candidatus Thorarchaeota archaeon]